jgi:hypothetical protein
VNGAYRVVLDTVVPQLPGQRQQRVQVAEAGAGGEEDTHEVTFGSEPVGARFAGGLRPVRSTCPESGTGAGHFMLVR